MASQDQIKEIRKKEDRKEERTEERKEDKKKVNPFDKTHLMGNRTLHKKHFRAAEKMKKIMHKNENF